MGLRLLLGRAGLRDRLGRRLRGLVDGGAHARQLRLARFEPRLRVRRRQPRLRELLVKRAHELGGRVGASRRLGRLLRLRLRLPLRFLGAPLGGQGALLGRLGRLLGGRTPRLGRVRLGTGLVHLCLRRPCRLPSRPSLGQRLGDPGRRAAAASDAAHAASDAAHATSAALGSSALGSSVVGRKIGRAVV